MCTMHTQKHKLFFSKNSQTHACLLILKALNINTLEENIYGLLYELEVKMQQL